MRLIGPSWRRCKAPLSRNSTSCRKSSISCAAAAARLIARAHDDTGKDLMDRARAVIRSLIDHETARLAQGRSAAAILDRALQYGIVGEVIVLLGLALVGLRSLRSQFAAVAEAQRLTQQANDQLRDETAAHERIVNSCSRSALKGEW
jgi:hypothetical protein